MNDLISRQAAIDGIAKLLAYHGSEGAWIDQKEALDVLRSLPSEQPEIMYYPQVDGVTPSVIAQPEIIMCKDCKHWFDAPVSDGYNSCEIDALIRHETFFCAAAERRIDGLQ